MVKLYKELAHCKILGLDFNCQGLLRSHHHSHSVDSSRLVDSAPGVCTKIGEQVYLREEPVSTSVNIERERMHFELHHETTKHTQGGN